MLFPTTDFAIFFAVVFALHWVLNPHRRAWKWFMLAASYAFYAWWDPRLVWLLALVSVLAQGGALWLSARPTSAAANGGRRRGVGAPAPTRMVQVLRLLRPQPGERPRRHRRSTGG
jgi:hypothetical protein